MAAKKRGLGRGLDALIGTVAQMPEDQPTEDVDGLRRLPVEWIQRGRYQPRGEIAQEALQELADSIKVQGLMQPIVVRPVDGERYEIIAGERRWRAAQLAGMDRIPVLIRDVPDEAAMAMALIENIQREDLNIVDEAMALQRLQQEFSLTHEEIARAVGKSRVTVSNILRLLQLEGPVRDLLQKGALEMGHARALLATSDSQQIELAQRAVRQGMSVRQVEALVRKALQGNKAPARKEADPDISRLEQRLSDATGASVSIRHQASGKGRLTFQYNSLDELQGLLDRIERRP